VRAQAHLECVKRPHDIGALALGARSGQRQHVGGQLLKDGRAVAQPLFDFGVDMAGRVISVFIKRRHDVSCDLVHLAEELRVDPAQ
jgi:hypothetical protein